MKAIILAGFLGLAAVCAAPARAQAPPPPVPPSCSAGWSPVASSLPPQWLSNDPVVAALIGPLNADAFQRMSAGPGGAIGLNAYFRAAIGASCS